MNTMLARSFRGWDFFNIVASFSAGVNTCKDTVRGVPLGRKGPIHKGLLHETTSLLDVTGMTFVLPRVRPVAAILRKRGSSPGNRRRPSGEGDRDCGNP